MAADATGTKSVTNTLSGTTADTVTLQQWWDGVEIINHDVANEAWVRFDGTAALADANECERIGPNTEKVIWQPVGPAATLGNGSTKKAAQSISIVGNGGQYTITGLQRRP